MKRNERKVASIVAILLTLSVFSGCGNKTSVKGESPQSTQDPGKVVTIDWMPQNDQPADSNSQLAKEVEKRFNVKINFIYMDRNQTTELLNIRVASGEIPDVMKFDAATYKNYAEQGVLAEIPEDKLLKKSPNLYNIVKKNGGDSAWENMKLNGKIYGIPALNQNGAYSFTPIWRDDWLKNVGINKIPETLQEAEDAFYKFVNNDPDKNGKKDTYAFSNTAINTVLGAYGGIAYSLGLYWIEKDGKIIPTATMPEMKEGLKLLNKWYKDGIIDPEFISGENKGQNKYNSVSFWNGKIGFSTSGTYYHVNPPLATDDSGSVNYVNFKKLQPNGTYAIGKPLTGPGGKSGTMRWGTYNGDSIAMGINAGKNPEKMDKILEIDEALVTDFDFYILENMGVKDINYKLENGDYKYIGDALNKDFRYKNAFGTNGIAYVEDNFDFKAKMQKNLFDYANKVAKTPSYVNPVVVGLPSESKYKANLSKKINEAYILFIVGEKDINDFDKFVADLNSNGLDQLTKEANDWYSGTKKK